MFFGEVGRRALALYSENDTGVLVATTSTSNTETARTTVMDAERMARALKDIEALWQAHDATVAGGNDAQV
ncbi:hypothetical protein D3C84_1292960 [compost metagenome]